MIATRWFDNIVAGLLPSITTVVAAWFAIQPFHIPGHASLSPAYILMAVYHWTIYRPELLPPLVVFLIGAIFDLISGGPPGVTALFLLLARAITWHSRRRFIGKPFLFVWGGFALLAIAAMGWRCGVHALLGSSPGDFRNCLFQSVLTVALFPIASLLLVRAQRALMSTR
ncbi:MAG: rod shape-determining protein MreD [Stellaceae bacterium]